METSYVCEFCDVFGHSTIMRDKRPRTDAVEKAQNKSEKEMVKMDNGGFVETMSRKRQAPQSYGIKKQQQPIIMLFSLSTFLTS